MPTPAEHALQALIGQLASGEAIDPDSIPDELRTDPVLQRLLRLSRVAHVFDREFSRPEPVIARDRIGPWRLLRVLGSGGMGEVWLGERIDELVEQRVAIKTLRVRTQDFHDRLLSERRILARLEHPNIARFIDAGVEEGGSPWFALEYVEGEPITQWCTRNATPLRARLQMFAKVCAAVEHAHRHLVVHRDLKPGNVLVNADGEPKLLDFGIAKLLDGSGDENTVGALTPSYAAPEQLRGEAVSTATDVYTLGLLLFRLLAGSLPVTRTLGSAGAVLAQLATEETLRPSASVVPGSPLLPYPASDLAGDLDAIVAQAIRSRPTDRYGSVAELSADIVRHLDGRAVRARPPTRRYRFARFARRNRVAMALGVVAAIALLAGIAVALHQAHRAEQTAVAARREQARAERVSDFLGSLYREQDPLNRHDAQARTPKRVIADAVTLVSAEFASDPLTQARLLRVLGEAQLNLDDVAAARATLDRAAGQATIAGDALAGAGIDSIRATLALHELRQDDAQRLFASALAAAVAARGGDSIEAARIEASQSISLVSLGRFKDAASAAAHARRVIEQRLGVSDPEAITARVTLGVIQEQLREDAAAIATLRAAIESIDATFGAHSARLVTPLQSLGEVLRRSRDFDAARAALDRGAQIAREQFGAKSTAVTGILTRWMGVERDAGDLARAIALADEAEAAIPADGDDGVLMQLLAARGSILLELDDGVGAEAAYRHSLALRRKPGEPETGLAWFTQAQVGMALAQQGRFDEAHALQAEAAKKLAALLGPDAYQNALIAVRRAQTFGLQHDYVNAVIQWREGVRLVEKTYGLDHFGHFDWSLELADALSRSAGGRSEAVRIVDGLFARWSDKAAIAARYPALALLRCRLHEAASERDAAQALARATLARSGLVATGEERKALERFATLAEND
jgi:tetratricopeptide (TPR) repeat protein